MNLNDLKEIKKAKGKLVNTRKFYKKKRQPGDFAVRAAPGEVGIGNDVEIEHTPRIA